MTTTHDVIGIGLGPFNLGLACLLDPLEELDAVFLEAKPEFDWHPGMLLESATLQTPFMADLVTLADPSSPLSFLSYLKDVGRLYSFYIRESFFPLRSEYNDYCRWAAARLSSLRFGRHVDLVRYDDVDDVFVVEATTATGGRESYRGRRLVLGTGTPAHLPDACHGVGGDLVHTSRYLAHKASLQAKQSITVVGSGQSAAEIYHDLLQDIDRFGYSLTWVTRSPRFFPLEYSKLTLEMTSPEYSDYFHALPSATRDALIGSQKSLYKGINTSLVDAIYDLLYVKSLRGACTTRLMTNTALESVAHEPGRGYTLGLRQQEQGRSFSLETEGLVMATGYRYEVPAFLAPVADRIRWDAKGRFDVRRNYSVDVEGGRVFVQNAELHTHGFVAPDLGMAAYRNSYIIAEILGREHYRLERSIAFQEFSAPVVDRTGAGARA